MIRRYVVRGRLGLQPSMAKIRGSMRLGLTLAFYPGYRIITVQADWGIYRSHENS